MLLNPPRSMLLRAFALLLPLALIACGGGGGVPADAQTELAGPRPPAPPVAVAPPPPPPVAVAPPVPALVGEARLGQLIFNDGNLSEPRGTACVACHQANQGFAGNNGSRIGVAQGSRPGVLGLRNAMTNSYAGFVPGLSFETVDGVTEALGGHFWDGRANTLAIEIYDAARQYVAPPAPGS